MIKYFISNICHFSPPVKDMYDYQGRSYLHIPQDVGVSLRSSDAPDKCYLPKKQLHVWSGHTKVSVTGQILVFIIYVYWLIEYFYCILFIYFLHWYW